MHGINQQEAIIYIVGPSTQVALTGAFPSFILFISFILFFIWEQFHRMQATTNSSIRRSNGNAVIGAADLVQKVAKLQIAYMFSLINSSTCCAVYTFIIHFI